MVSYPEPADRDLSIRRPPSVASRATTTTRRHRQNRSHHGSNAYLPQNDFPVFTHTGDVEIIVGAGGQENRYLLHRLILSQCSGFFEAGTSQEWSQSRITESNLSCVEEGSTMNSHVSGQGEKRKWRYELDWGDGDDVPMLVQKAAKPTIFGGGDASRPPPVRNKPAPPSAGFFRSVANLSILPQHTQQPSPTDDILRDYDNLFRIFYNHPPTLDAVNIANAYVDCKSLLNLADMYDALEVVGPRVDHHLLQFQGRLWKQIAKYPPSYLRLGYLARSKVIFAEALNHVVGQWPTGAAQLRGQLPDVVMEIIEDKVDELEEMKSKIEGRLFRLTLTTSRGERVTPLNSYLDWLAVSLFRQWLAENTTPPPAPILKNPPSSVDGRNVLPPPPTINTGRIYRMLGIGGSAYLPHDELKRFLKLQSDKYSRDSLKKFERRMDEVKHLARDAVKPLMRNFLQLEVGREASGGVGYLTCTRVEERDFPWDG